MTRHRFVIVGATVFAICMLCLVNRFSQAQGEKAAKPSALAEAASQAYDSTVAAFQNGSANTEDVYQWSRRLMDAEAGGRDERLAIAGHIVRMKWLHDLVAAQANAGAAGVGKRALDATTFYLLEANAMMERQK